MHGPWGIVCARRALDLGGSGLNGGACSAGGRYRAGEGVPQDYLKALRWVRKLAELGNVGQKEYKQSWH